MHVWPVFPPPPMPLKRVRSLQYRWLHFLQPDIITSCFPAPASSCLSSCSLAASSTLAEAIEMTAFPERQEEGTGQGHGWEEVGETGLLTLWSSDLLVSWSLYLLTFLSLDILISWSPDLLISLPFEILISWSPDLLTSWSLDLIRIVSLYFLSPDILISRSPGHMSSWYFDLLTSWYS